MPTQNLQNLIQTIQEEKITTIDKPIFEENDFFNRFKAIAPKFGKKGVFNIDAENEKQIRYLLMYFANSPKFNEIKPCKGDSIVFKYEPDLSKGLIVIGNVGSGKSNLLRIFHEMKIPSNYFRIAYGDVITDDYKRLGPPSMYKYFDAELKYNIYGTKESMFLFDDLGYEKKVKDYGNDVNCMMDIIMKRDRLFQDYGTRSLFTTNLSLKEIEQYYDNRTLSRIIGMCNVIYLGNKADSKDRRK